MRPLLKNIRGQYGAATLVVALVLLLAITFMTFSGVRVSVNEQRISANEGRYREALAVAQAGIEYGIAYLEENKNIINAPAASGGWSGSWTPCNTNTAFPCGNGVVNNYSSGGPPPGGWHVYTGTIPSVSVSDNYSYNLKLLTPITFGTLPAENPALVLVSQATSPDPLASKATIKQMVQGYPITINIPAYPLIAKDRVQLSERVRVWANPVGRDKSVNVTTVSTSEPDSDPAPTYTTDSSDPYITTITDIDIKGGVKTTTVTSGKPLSIWVGSTNGTPINLQGNNGNNNKDSLTCTGVYSSTSCTVEVTSKNNLKADTRTGSFPSDLFFDIFGVKSTDYLNLKNEITILGSCSPFNSASKPPSGIYWITGDCEIDEDITTVGSNAEPVVLIIEGKLKSEDLTYFYGIIFMKNRTNGATVDSSHNGIIEIDNSSRIYGALLSDVAAPVDVDREVHIIYDAAIIDKATKVAGSFAKVPGGWTDDNP